MLFLVERMNLTGPDECILWNDASIPRATCEVVGSDAGCVLSAVVAREGGVEVGVRATYTDGQAVTVAQKESVLYALRAVPH